MDGSSPCFGSLQGEQGASRKTTLYTLETTIVYWGYIGIMEKKMETIIVYWVKSHRFKAFGSSARTTGRRTTSRIIKHPLAIPDPELWGL